MAREEGKTPGDAMTSPFGDGKGATQATGASSGAHDFLTDPASAAPASGGRDFTRENRAQKSGAPLEENPESVPAGGELPFKGEPMAVQHTPFKLR